MDGNIDILFTHPEGLLSTHGRVLLKSVPFLESVASVVIDKAHNPTSSVHSVLISKLMHPIGYKLPCKKSYLAFHTLLLGKLSYCF